MSKKIKTVYVVHHSHTDIGYTDLQERVIHCQANYIRTVLHMMKQPENADFRWNCETYYCVEEFFKSASQEEKEEFFQLVREGKLGFSATYLNFNDLLDSDIYKERLKEIVTELNQHGFEPKTAMIADINGISMGQRDAMIDNGIEFLFTNIHCHHGMYPLYQNQTPYYWENAAGKRLLVWNGEHYNLGNALGIKANPADTYMGSNYFGKQTTFVKPVEILHKNLTEYLTLCEEHNYRYQFIISSVSGVFSDNAPPNREILETIEAYNEIHGDEVTLKMVSLQELYSAIKGELEDAPVYRGDLTDWWANGVGSTPYAVKHYKEAKHLYHLCGRLNPMVYEKYPDLTRVAQDNLMLYAEHTWGHSATITNPYDTMVLNLDMRKNSYASKAHESSALMLTRTAEELGDIMRYYNTNGTIKVINTSDLSGTLPVEFYIESYYMKNASVTDPSTGKEIICQASRHPRGLLVSFTDHFQPHETKEYHYHELPEAKQLNNSRIVYTGSEGIRDIVNNYDAVTYRLPYEFENDWFYLSYEPSTGIKEFRNKKTNTSLLREDVIPFFTPIYEVTKVQHGETSVYEDRRRLGRNIRGCHAKLHIGDLNEVRCLDHGPVFTTLEFGFTLPGTTHANVIVKFYHAIPRIDYKLQLGKTISNDIESIYLPMTLSLGGEQAYLKKGEEAFRPGIDQIPGTCMEYYMSDYGVVFQGCDGSILIESKDVPLITMGQLKHHPILLCDQNPANNTRPLYSWIMNNTWETNFKLDLSGFSEFQYSLTLSDETDPEKAFQQMMEQSFGTYSFIIE